ncbi:MAG: hypothetical protein QX189_06630 [Methylococcales bacterium]
MPAMKKTIIALFVALLVTGYAHAEQTERVIHLLDKEIMDKREGIYYAPNENIPFTGKAVHFDPNGQQRWEGNYVNGKTNGLFTSWNANGQKTYEGHLVNGKQNGSSTMWFDNGQKMFENHYVDGKENGLSTMWLDNGQKVTEIIYVNGIDIDSSEKIIKRCRNSMGQYGAARVKECVDRDIEAEIALRKY